MVEYWRSLEVIVLVRTGLTELAEFSSQCVISQHTFTWREGVDSFASFARCKTGTCFSDDGNTATGFDLAEQGAANGAGGQNTGVKWSALIEQTDIGAWH